MLLNGRADLVGGPTNLQGLGGMLQQETFHVYALKSVVVHSETLSLMGTILRMDPYY